MTSPTDLLRVAIEHLVAPGAVTEMRALGTAQGIVSGYFDDREALLVSATQLDGLAKGVHLMLNRVRPELLARANNRAIPYTKTATADNDIVHRDWLMIDFDPKRPSGISATNSEHDSAIARARECREWLRSIGWADPLFADSGNGAHLDYKVDLSNDAASTALVKNILAAIGLRFTDAVVEVDQTTFNAARLTKLYGTMACKGDHTEERPHRRSAIIEVPSHIEVVSLELLKAVAAMAPEVSAPTKSRSPVGSFEIEKWIVDHDVLILKDGPWSTGGHKWILEQCPWNEEHRDGAAFIVKLPTGAIGAGCLHNGCSSKGWHPAGARGTCAPTARNCPGKSPFHSRSRTFLHFRPQSFRLGSGRSLKKRRRRRRRLRTCRPCCFFQSWRRRSRRK